jgi:hypothetical protein
MQGARAARTPDFPAEVASGCQGALAKALLCTSHIGLWESAAFEVQAYRLCTSFWRGILDFFYVMEPSGFPEVIFLSTFPLKG